MSKDEIMDEELAGMVNHKDETGSVAMPVMEQKPRPKAEPKTEEAMDASYVTMTEKPRDLIDGLFGMTKWMGICGGIAMLLWWFWQNDLMAMEAAYPCILACGVIGAFGAGMNFRK